MVINQQGQPDLIKPKTYAELKREGQLRLTIVDGLDAAGKGTINKWIKYIARLAGKNVVALDLPNYDSFIGKQISLMLTKLGLGLEERAAAFALNRLECENALKNKVEDAYLQNGNDVIVAFNRFSSSNLLTWAYIIKSQLPAGLPLEEYREALELLKPRLAEFLCFMKDLDSEFHKLLGIDLSEQIIWIPQISPEQANMSLINDVNREGRVDKYEAIEVQEIAYWLYQFAADLKIFNFKIVDQVIDGDRLKAKELALMALQDFGIEIDQDIIDSLPEKLPDEASEKVVFEVGEPSPEAKAAQELLLEKYPALRNLTEHLEP